MGHFWGGNLLSQFVLKCPQKESTNNWWYATVADLPLTYAWFRYELYKWVYVDTTRKMTRSMIDFVDLVYPPFALQFTLCQSGLKSLDWKPWKETNVEDCGCVHSKLSQHLQVSIKCGRGVDASALRVRFTKMFPVKATQYLRRVSKGILGKPSCKKNGQKSGQYPLWVTPPPPKRVKSGHLLSEKSA